MKNPPPAERVRTVLYAVYDNFGTPELEQVEVIPWGKGLALAPGQRTGMAFGCRNRFTPGLYATSEKEAWQRYLSKLRNHLSWLRTDQENTENKIKFVESKNIC